MTEAKHRDALHSALNTDVGLAIDALEKHPSIAVPDRAAGEIVSCTENGSRRDSPPRGAQQQLEQVARAKLLERPDASTGRDRLTETLRDAGAR